MGCAGDVDAFLEAGPEDGREALPDRLRLGVGGQVKEDIVRVGDDHLLVDGPGDLVARGQIPQRRVFLHERLAVPGLEPRPLAAHGLRDEKAVPALAHEDGRMELDVFHVADPGPGAQGHGVAGAVGPGRIAGVEKDGAATAGGQYGERREDAADPARGVVHDVGADRPRLAVIRDGVLRVVGHGQEIDGRPSGEERDPGVLLERPQEPVFDRPPGRVLDVEDAAARMSPFEGVVEGVGRAAGEGDLELVDERLVDEARAVRDEDVDGRRVADAVPRFEDVPLEELGLVVRGEGHDAALGIIGVGFLGPGVLGDDDDTEPGGGGLEGGGRPGDAAAYDQDVGPDIAFAHEDLNGRNPC